MISEQDRQILRGIQSDEEAKAKAEKLPEYVKCMYCGERPKWGDLLGEVVPHSSALAHESCMAERGKIFGLNAGTMDDLGNVLKGANNNDSSLRS